MENKEWELVWEDKFLGNYGEKPSTKRWTFETGGHGWGNRELQFYTDSHQNVHLNGEGNLVIRANFLPASSLSCWYGPCKYTSARLSTKNSFSFKHGRINARVKFPKGNGLWSAVWMLGTHDQTVIWPDVGEIDIVEHLGGFPDRVYGSVHGPNYSHIENNHLSQVLFANSTIEFCESFNNFSVIWNENSIEWLINEQKYFSICKSEITKQNKKWVFDNYFHLILNLAVGGTWAGYPDEKKEYQSKNFLIDYIQVFQKSSDFLRQPTSISMGDKKVMGNNASLNPNSKMRAEILKEIIPPHGIGAEIGVHKGVFTHAIIQILKPQKLHLIDLWYLFGEKWPWATEDKSTINALIQILDTFRQELVEKSVILHIGFALDVLKEMPNNYFDWVYLDTSHRYEDTLKELNLLKAKVKPDGIIAGDDWYPDPQELHYGVYKAVNEFINQNNYALIYSNVNNKQWAIRQRV